EERARMDARVSAQGLSPLADDDGTEALAQHQLSGDRLPEHHLLQRAETEADEGESRRSRSRTVADVRKARHSAARAKAVGRSSCRRGFRFGLRCDDLQRKTQEARRDLLFVYGSDQGVPGSGEEISRLGGSDQRQLLRRLE